MMDATRQQAAFDARVLAIYRNSFLTADQIGAHNGLSGYAINASLDRALRNERAGPSLVASASGQGVPAHRRPARAFSDRPLIHAAENAR